MLHSLAALLKFFLLAFLQFCIFEFLELELEEVVILAIAFNGESHLTKFFLCFNEFGVSILILSKLRRIVGDDINYFQLKVLLVEQQVLMLRVNIHQHVAKLFQHRQCHRRVVDESAAFSCSSKLTTNNTIASIVLDIVLVEERLHIIARQIEVCLDDTLFCPLFYCLRISTLTKQQSYRTKDDALTSTSLTSDDRESLVQRDIKLINQRKVLNI